MSYIILFISAFTAATLLPLQSEAVLMGLLIQGKAHAGCLLLVATLGNVLGSCVNWWLGLKIEKFKGKKWFPISITQMHKAQHIYKKYGFYSLFLSWLPVIGDPITLIAGVMREGFLRFLVLVTIAKGLRYLVLYALYMQIF